MDTLSVLEVDELEAVAVVDADDVKIETVLEAVRKKVLRDEYPFSICVDGIASR